MTRSVNTNSPTSPVVTFNVLPGTNAACVAVTELLPLGLSATSVTAGGNYVASNNVVLWGPFFGTNAQTLSYQLVGQAGIYQTRATWSVDGVSASEAVATNIVIASTPGNGFPTPPPQAPMPMLSPSNATNLPVNVSISSSDPQAQVYFTTDGTLPTLSSTPYTTPLAFSTQTTLRARAFRAGYLPSVAALGNYVPLQTTNSLVLVRSVVGNGTFIPSVTVIATPSVGVNCYSVTETIVPGLTPSGLSADAVWNPSDKTVRWGPYLDNQQRSLTYNLFSASSGAYPLSGQGSFNGFPSPVTGATAVTVNAEYSGSPNTNFPACITAPITYNLNFNPNPGIITIDSVSGTLNWGDGTQVVVTQAVMSFQKIYATSRVYTVTLSVDWTGHTIDMTVSGHATKTDTINAVTQCNPVILVQPQPTNQLVLVGATAQISVNATSVFPMSYQWYFNVTNPIVSPSTFQILTLENVRLEAGGLYSVLIANAYGSVTSSVARLNVIAPLVANITRNANGSITLNFVGMPNSTTRLWAATNLGSPIFWTPIFTNNVGDSGTWQFTDTNTMNYPARFYRFSTP